VSQFLQFEIDRDAFADGKIAGGSNEGAIAADAAGVNYRVLDLVVPFAIRRVL
jgi:hypothetical protein